MSTLPQLSDILKALATISGLLKDTEYAIIGAAALISMGMTIRSTRDIDILVPTNSVSQIKTLLSNHKSFTLDPRTRHMTYTSTSSATFDIDVLPPSLARIPYEEVNPILKPKCGAEEVKVACPATLLNYKIATAYSRPGAARKRSDWSDVTFLAHWHWRNEVKLEPGRCVNARYQALLDCRQWGNEITDEVWRFIGGEVESDEVFTKEAGGNVE